MKTIYVCFNDLKLGTLIYEDGKYIYQTIDENIAEAVNRGYLLSLYKCKESFVSEALPNAFRTYVLDNKQLYMFPQAKILPYDDDFTRLYKLAGLKDVIFGEFHFEVLD